MKKLLIINSSAKGNRSHSRKLTEAFSDHWGDRYPGARVRVRELGEGDIPHINETWIAAAFKSKAERSEAENRILERSDNYIAELQEADVIAIGVPMYNWSIPSTLKAYIDQVLRVNETFRYDRSCSEHPYVGLLQDKTLILLYSRGEADYTQGGANGHMNFQDTYLTAVFTVIGIRKIYVIGINGASSGAHQLNHAIEQAMRDIGTFVADQPE